jgi:predicted nucleic-acid-binding Zn-ribbon protein
MANVGAKSYIGPTKSRRAMKNGVCLKCQSTDVRKMETRDSRGDHGTTLLNLVTYKDPDAFFFKGTTFYPMLAMACFQCGYVEFYMDLSVGIFPKC